MSVGVLSAMLLLAGCLTRRQEALEARFPRNRVFEPGRLAQLDPEKPYFLGEWDRACTQSLCLLRVAPGAMLRKSYHAEHDMTLFVVAGSAILKVEETRYFVEPGSAVLLPRYTAYSVTPHQTQEEFVAVMVFSPGFDEEDTFVEE